MRALVAQELDDTKSFFVGSFAADRETPQQVASELWMLELNKLPIDFLEQSLARVAKTDAAACTKMVKDSLNPAHMVIVVVGDAAIGCSRKPCLRARRESRFPIGALRRPASAPNKLITAANP